MARPKCCRHVYQIPSVDAFPSTDPTDRSDFFIQLTLDEWEAIRLSDLENLYQSQAATIMSVSRQTFGRILISARHKLAQALIRGRRLKIDGGPVRFCGGHTSCEICCETSIHRPEKSPDGKCPACGRCRHTPQES